MPAKTNFFSMMILLFFSACTKSAGDNNNGNGGPGNVTPPANYLLHTSHSSTTSTAPGAVNFSEEKIFNYDKANNAVTVYLNDTSSTGIFADTITYKLTGDIITTKYKVASFEETFYLNKQHTYIDSTLTINGTAKIRYSYANTFDANGKITFSTITGIVNNNGVPGTPTTQTAGFTWQNGNQVRSTNSAFDYVNTYDENRLAAPPDPIIMVCNPFLYFTYSKNEIKTAGSTSHFNHSVDNLVYSYDDKGRIIKATGSNNTDGSTYLIIDTYY